VGWIWRIKMSSEAVGAIGAVSTNATIKGSARAARIASLARVVGKSRVVDEGDTEIVDSPSGSSSSGAATAVVTTQRSARAGNPIGAAVSARGEIGGDGAVSQGQGRNGLIINRAAQANRPAAAVTASTAAKAVCRNVTAIATIATVSTGSGIGQQRAVHE